MINKVTLIGNLGKDPEVINTNNGTQVTKFSLATSESWKNKQTGEWDEKTEWHNVVLFGNSAERAGQQLVKGNKIYLEGKITYGSYEDKDGNKRYTTDIVGNYFRFLGQKENSNDAPPVSAHIANDEPIEEDLPF